MENLETMLRLYPRFEADPLAREMRAACEFMLENRHCSSARVLASVLCSLEYNYPAELNWSLGTLDDRRYSHLIACIRAVRTHGTAPHHFFINGILLFREIEDILDPRKKNKIKIKHQGPYL